MIISLAFKPDVVFRLYETAGVKTAVYFTEGNSARGDSYRVMLESLISPNIFGEGLGAFGGPASTKYLSPLYEEYNFNWYALEGKLNTTDTYYPHLFVELGLIGGLLYLYFIFFTGKKSDQDVVGGCTGVCGRQYELVFYSGPSKLLRCRSNHVGFFM